MTGYTATHSCVRVGKGSVVQNTVYRPQPSNLRSPPSFY